MPLNGFMVAVAKNALFDQLILTLLEGDWKTTEKYSHNNKSKVIRTESSVDE